MYETLSPDFLAAMNEIGQYGSRKYGEQSFEARMTRGDNSRGGLDRNEPSVIAQHAKEHFEMYLANLKHDYFGTRRHQLAAVAFNAMMEFHYAGLAEEESNADHLAAD